MPEIQAREPHCYLSKASVSVPNNFNLVVNPILKSALNTEYLFASELHFTGYHVCRVTFCLGGFQYAFRKEGVLSQMEKRRNVRAREKLGAGTHGIICASNTQHRAQQDLPSRNPESKHPH